jgi:hypothetical protein
MKVWGAFFTALIIAGVAFFATHHAVYGKCHQEADQRICTLLKWEANK